MYFFTIFYLDISWLLHSLLNGQKCWRQSCNGAAGFSLDFELLFRNIHANLAKPACSACELSAVIKSTVCRTDTKVTIIINRCNTSTSPGLRQAPPQSHHFPSARAPCLVAREKPACTLYYQLFTKKWIRIWQNIVHLVGVNCLNGTWFSPSQPFLLLLPLVHLPCRCFQVSLGELYVQLINNYSLDRIA